MSNKDERLPGEDEIAAQVHARINRTLANPELQTALEELRALTPPGEPMFGFKLQAADARSEVPKAEHIEPEAGQAIVADKDAAAAYVEGAVPTAGPLPRMPTGRVRLSTGEQTARAAANTNRAADADNRRQTTQPSIRKGGSGPPPPTLADDPESPWATEAGATEASTTPTATSEPATELAHGPAAMTEPASRRHSEPSRRREWIAVMVGLLFMAVVAALILRAPPGHAPAMTSTTATSSPALAPPEPSAISSTANTTAAPILTGAPNAAETSSSAPIIAPPSTSSAAPSVAPRSSGAPTATAAPTSAPTAPTAPPSASPTVAPSAAPAVAPSSAPTAAPNVAPRATTAPTTSPAAPFTGRQLEKD